MVHRNEEDAWQTEVLILIGMAPRAISIEILGDVSIRAISDPLFLWIDQIEDVGHGTLIPVTVVRRWRVEPRWVGHV